MALRIYGNRLLTTLPGEDTRPTAARVREALFNMWQGKIDGCRWLDLCTGSGAMGAEALCRGAAQVVGIERSAAACKVIEQNWQLVARPEQQYELRRGDVMSQVARLTGQQFDRIYFDPPYDSRLYDPILAVIAIAQLLAPNGELAVEHSPQRVPESVRDLVVVRTKVYGRSALTFFGNDVGNGG
jgi:16S rRNA (guanine966-N2)-methyltransferase